ncbi:hypothetical protein ACROYT_G031149 [Oculina patagonica]
MVYCENNFTQVDTNSSCVQTVPSVSASARNASCIFYTYSIKGGFCDDILKESLYVFGDRRTLKYGEKQTSRFRSYFDIFNIADTCRPLMRNLYCRYHFPPCETSLDKPHARQICRRTCEALDQELCKAEMIYIRKGAKDYPVFDVDMINCSLYDVANGGDAPECYQYYPLSGDDTISTECYYGVGVGYRGNVNVTRYNRTCQAWTKQCPHRHWRIPRDVVDGRNDSNMCRNPDSSAPYGPWCYTTDPNVRWEYCDVPRCPPRVPKKAPTMLRGYPLNSTAIHISWNSLPPSRYKEQLLGYRVRYRSVGSQKFTEATITSNLTEIVVIGLAAQTRYEIEVNGFNENGYGPISETFVIKTLSFGEVIIDINLQLMIDADFNRDLLNHNSSKFVAMEAKIETSIKHHFNKSSVLEIYDVRIMRFSNESVKADIKILATINTNTTEKGDAIDHIIEELEYSLWKGLKVTAIVIPDKPPPPKELSVKNVQTRYMVLTWDEPKYGSLYQIHNYTIEDRKSASENFTIVRTLPYTQTGMILKDLQPSTEYTIRLSSNNRYGRSYGVFVTERTLPDRFIRDLMLIIVLPLTLAALFIVVACFKFFRSTRKTEPEKEGTELGIRGDWLEIRKSDLTLQEKLGEGAFGEAYKCLLKVDGKARKCAVKKLKANATEKDRRDLINELQIMVTVGEHPNVVSLIGACTRGESILVVVRLAENGCLLNQLKKSKENQYYNDAENIVHFSQIDKTRIARDVASGMLHLSNKKCVHRDLAARNVLLGRNNVAMVSDFGLSRDVYESGEYENISGGMLPVRWMAPESCEDYIYNTKTDVWSFGVLLWEIESGGKMPYSGLGGMEVVEFIKSGKRLRKPNGCPDEM